jgi:uncharacterized phage infection (PIP) family protein YhgE
LEASEAVLANSMAKKIYVDEAVADAIHTMEQQTQDLDFEHRETRKRLDALGDKGIKDLAKRFSRLETTFDQVEGLEKKVMGITEAFDVEDKRRDGELREMERRWGGEVDRVERCLEEKMEEKFQEQDNKLVERQSQYLADFNSYVEGSLKRLQTDIQQEWWIGELERREKALNEEMKMMLKQHPTHQEVAASYTMLATTSDVIDQVGQLHTKTGRDHHLLQSGLNTLERLYLRQLDSSAPMVSRVIHTCNPLTFY